MIAGTVDNYLGNGKDLIPLGHGDEAALTAIPKTLINDLTTIYVAPERRPIGSVEFVQWLAEIGRVATLGAMFDVMATCLMPVTPYQVLDGLVAANGEIHDFSRDFSFKLSDALCPDLDPSYHRKTIGKLKRSASSMISRFQSRAKKIRRQIWEREETHRRVEPSEWQRIRINVLCASYAIPANLTAALLLRKEYEQEQSA